MQDPANEATRAVITTAPYFDRSKILGSGTFATVYEGLAGVAVKRIELIKVTERFKGREEAAMKIMDHPNVLKLLDAKEDFDFKYLILERCTGTVRDYINGDEKFNSNMPPETEALRQMASGLDYIHSKNVVHRDIKPENVLISFSFILKISDFGCCKPMPSDGCLSVTSGPQGTRVYYAPEYLRLEGNKITAEDRKKITADKSIDTFSLGCLFFTYIIKEGPFIHLFATPGKKFYSRETYASDVTDNILNGRKFLNENGIPIGHYAYEIIEGMTKAHPKERWGLNEDKSGVNLNTVLGTLNRELQREQQKK